MAELVPDDWLQMFEQFRQTVLAVQARLDMLPRGLVHGDAWPANAVQTSPAAVMLIDWETSGLGLPVLDLGQCLLECLLDAVPSGPPSGTGAGSGCQRRRPLRYGSQRHGTRRCGGLSRTKTGSRRWPRVIGLGGC